MGTQVRVVVVGGGFAGLETAFSLRAKLGHRAALTLVSDRDEFLFKPNTIYIPFGADPQAFLLPLAPPARKRDLELVSGKVTGIDSDSGQVDLEGRELSFDFAVLATGATMRPTEIPGLEEHAETIWTPTEMLSLRGRLTDLVARARKGERLTVLFTVPPGNKCAGPLYEIVFMLETWLRRQGVRDQVRLVFSTYEETFIQAFGPKLHDVVLAEFAARGIEGHSGRRLSSVADGDAFFEGGTTATEPFDLMIAFPPYLAAVDYASLPSDERGFLMTSSPSRRVLAQDRIYAPGDAGDFPVKQAFLAFLQADAVAEEIAAQVLGREAKEVFDPVSMCVMEELDTATFAQVPLIATGNPDRPVAVRADADGDYRVGVSPLWRVGKKMLGFYLPFRFKAGLPFHSGAPWRAMELGLKGMATILARR
jgi:NADH dehydrogenase FAD-containing subunit